LRRLFWIVAISGGLLAIPHLLGYDVTVGGLVVGQEGLERQHKRGYRRSRIVLGGCVISKNIDVRMLTEVIPSLIVCGGLVAPKSIIDAYGPDLKIIGPATFGDPGAA